MTAATVFAVQLKSVWLNLQSAPPLLPMVAGNEEVELALTKTS